MDIGLYIYIYMYVCMYMYVYGGFYLDPHLWGYGEGSTPIIPLSGGSTLRTTSYFDVNHRNTRALTRSRAMLLCFILLLGPQSPLVGHRPKLHYIVPYPWGGSPTE